ncbi:MAG: ATP phosphoribosyltransferase [Hyphomonadaceae bacterium]|nr:ATP phosphoribosyltransferase [Hyphomonadaceae bacterium]
MSTLIIGVPSKGRLQEQTLAFFADCGLAISQDGGKRGYAARMAGQAAVEVRLLSAGDITAALRDGDIHVGVTGEDLLRELGAGFQRIIMVKPLGFGRADLVVAAPSAWLDVTTMADLDEVSAAMRARTGKRLRVATKYLKQTHAFLDGRGVDDYRIVESLGATEGAPAAGVADVIVDITTTGATLSANHLKTLSDGLILKSQAQLAASRAATWPPEARAVFAAILDQIEAREQGRALKLVRAAVGAAKAEALQALVVRMGGRLASESEPGLFAFYCPAERAPEASAAAGALGAGPVGVFGSDYVFERTGALSRRFSDDLGPE